LYYSATSGSGACAMPGSATTYYANSSILAELTMVYTDSGGTTAAPDGYYSDGTNFWQATSGQLGATTGC
jgi:hypothetical protein